VYCVCACVVGGGTPYEKPEVGDYLVPCPSDLFCKQRRLLEGEGWCEVAD
jgi:hypothetical protein